ncbi:MAG: hypothetical protein KAH38_02070 [Candidatus Hydrogenedentes bacterium]|nr:hypothetical protein [Candidatus Hydrogenedentota bacterium]
MTMEDKMIRWRNEELLERILENETTAIGMTRKILLWRGFLTTTHEGTLCLDQGSHLEDISLLQKFLPIETVDSHECTPDGTPLDIFCRITPTKDKKILRSLLSNTFKYTGRIGNSDFIKSRVENRDFGRRVPVIWLDPGVALLTKVLPLLRLEVWWSCEGHDPETPPEIRFATAADLQWARVALPQFLPPNDPFVQCWALKNGKSWGSLTWHLDKQGCRDNAEACYTYFSRIQKLCRNIMDSYWDEDGCYNPLNSLANRARQYGGEWKRWDNNNYRNNPKNYVFSEEHARNTFDLPHYEEAEGEQQRICRIIDER